MANEKITAQKETGSKLTPVIIIGAIFLATIFGIYMISQSGEETPAGDQSGATNGNTQGSGDGTVPNYANAPAGATPATFKGSESSPVVIEEFADFQCGACRTVHPKMNEIVSRYGDRIRFVFRHYPLTQAHPNAYDAAVAAEAAGRQGKFWDMQNLIFNNQTAWANSQNARRDFEGYAERLGLDVEQFKNDMLAMNTKSRVDADLNRGRALDIRSTPTVLINGRMIPYQQLEVDTLSRIIDAELAKFDQKPDAAPAEDKANTDGNKEDANTEAGDKPAEPGK